MTTAQVVETSVTVNDNSPIQDYVNPDDQTQPNSLLSGILEFSLKLLPENQATSLRVKVYGGSPSEASRLCDCPVTPQGVH